ncbi:MAG: DUF4345 family protein [Owenweeksia sp.]
MREAYYLIIVNSVLFILFGLGFICFPEEASLLVTDTLPDTPSGMIEMRANYGGVSLGLGLLLAFCARTKKAIVWAAWAVIFVVGGMSIGRFIGIMAEQAGNTIVYFLFIVELYLISATLLALIRIKLDQPEGWEAFK